MDSIEKPPVTKHLFICTNKKEGRPSCGEKGAALVDQLKPWIKENKLTHAKVTRSGCLSHCEHAVAAVCYPAGEWNINITENDIDRLKDMLK